MLIINLIWSLQCPCFQFLTSWSGDRCFFKLCCCRAQRSFFADARRHGKGMQSQVCPKGKRIQIQKLRPVFQSGRKWAWHRFIKKTVLLQPPFWPKVGVFFQLWFFETKNIDVEQKHNLKSGKKKAKIRKRDWKEKARQETKKEKRFQENKVAV